MAKKELKKDKDNYPIDENLTIPESVRARAAAADALHKRVYNPDPPAADPAEPVTAAPAEPVTPQGNPEPAAAAPAEPAPAPASKPVDDWEHKFNSMKGRFERSEAEKRRLNDRMSGLEQVIATMQTPPEPEKPAELDAASLLTAAEREAYGDDFITTVGKVARQNVHPEVAQLKNELKNLQGQLKDVGATIGQTAKDRMHDYLTQHCPNWLEVNQKQEFMDWLALPDAYSGDIKHELLKRAYAANDGPRVLNFFKGFLAEEAALVPPTDTAPAAEVVAHKVPLESFAAPGRAKTAASPPGAPAEKPIFTRAFVSKFYTDCASGKYRGREEEKNRIDFQIVEAGREGRIR
jgi:hypothetical protein